MNDYIGYMLGNKILIGYFCNLEHFSSIYSNAGILYVLTSDEKYLMKIFNISARYPVYSDMKTVDLEEDYIGFLRLAEYKSYKHLKPQKKYTREDINNYILKLRLVGNQNPIYSYETFKSHIWELIRTNEYQSLIDAKKYDLKQLWDGKLKYPAIERKGSKYRYVGAIVGKYYTRQADTDKEELIRYLEVL